tara:strand:+ start:627 stop:1328 length:702 start_codon:yes stop_codon:yes gene_type:complete
MDFIFMLTKGDKTIADCLAVMDEINEIELGHIGFKDIGVEKDTLRLLNKKIKDAGSTSYLEVVSTTREAAQNSIRLARELGVDRVCGGQEMAFAAKVLRDTGIEYLPFVGAPVGHPTKLEGTGERIAADCSDAVDSDCFGVDLLAYRAVDAEPLVLVEYARRALKGGYLLVAGSIDCAEQIEDIYHAGADGFTIGSAIFAGKFSKGRNQIQPQLTYILDTTSKLTEHPRLSTG